MTNVQLYVCMYCSLLFKGLYSLEPDVRFYEAHVTRAEAEDQCSTDASSLVILQRDSHVITKVKQATKFPKGQRAWIGNVNDTTLHTCGYLGYFSAVINYGNCTDVMSYICQRDASEPDDSSSGITWSMGVAAGAVVVFLAVLAAVFGWRYWHGTWPNILGCLSRSSKKPLASAYNPSQPATSPVDHSKGSSNAAYSLSEEPDGTDLYAMPDGLNNVYSTIQSKDVRSSLHAGADDSGHLSDSCDIYSDIHDDGPSSRSRTGTNETDGDDSQSQYDTTRTNYLTVNLEDSSAVYSHTNDWNNTNPVRRGSSHVYSHMTTSIRSVTTDDSAYDTIQRSYRPQQAFEASGDHVYNVSLRASDQMADTADESTYDSTLTREADRHLDQESTYSTTLQRY